MRRKIFLEYPESVCCCLKTIKHATLASRVREPKLDMTEIICLSCRDLMLESLNLLKGNFHAIALDEILVAIA
jgi:hypothetical protein